MVTTMDPVMSKLLSRSNQSGAALLLKAAGKVVAERVHTLDPSDLFVAANVLDDASEEGILDGRVRDIVTAHPRVWTSSMCRTPFTMQPARPIYAMGGMQVLLDRLVEMPSDNPDRLLMWSASDILYAALWGRYPGEPRRYRSMYGASEALRNDLHALGRIDSRFIEYRFAS